MKTTNLKVTHPGIKLYFLTEILPDTNTAKNLHTSITNPWGVNCQRKPCHN